MEISWFLFLTWCANLVASFDLGPIIRIAQCKSQCLRKHTVDGTCDWYSGREQTTCGLCWQYCETLEDRWEKTKTICEGDQYLHCPACQTACVYRKTRVEERYLPSMLPAPRKGPVTLDRFDVAVTMRKSYRQWRMAGYYTKEQTPNLRPDVWIIVVVKDGVKHYSWQDWVPTLDSLKEGPLYEATVSWKNLQSQLHDQRSVDQVRFNNRVREYFLQKYGEKVLAEWRSQEDSQMTDEIFRKFFFKRKDEHADDSLNIDNSPSTGSSFDEGKDGQDQSGNKESYVVSWEPETGGLMGNQVTDSNSAQISLLPGTKYLVRIASNEGPGSFPIEVDTRPGSIQVERIKEDLKGLHALEAFVAFCCSVFLTFIVAIILVCRRSRKIDEIEKV